MKVLDKPKQIERHGVQETINCKVSDNAFAFRMLIRNYSDPIKAILQEIGANCADAHSRAGKSDVPFDVSLPGMLDPHIRWRDYGISMDEDTIRNVYGVLMESDKRSSNDETGCFGIGSKTPLAYTDSFNICTFLNGTLSHYVVYFDEDGRLAIDVLGKFDTDEPNGVEVSFAVKKDDWSKFEERAKHVYSFYGTLPNVNGNSDFALNTDAKLMEGKDWSVYGTSKSSYLVMGNIGYRISNSQFQYGSRAYNLFNNGLVFKVPVGSVSMTPSREGLEYNSDTINFINSHVESIYHEVLQKLKDSVNEHGGSQWSKTLKAIKILANFSSHFTSDHLSYESKVSLPHPFTYIYTERSRKSKSPRGNDTVPVSNKIKIIIKDEKSRFDVKCKHYLRQNRGDINFVYLMDNITKQEVLDYIGADESDNVVLNVSGLPSPPRLNNGSGSSGQRKSTRTVKFYDDSTSNSYYKYKNWPSKEIDHKNDTHVFVELNRFEASSRYLPIPVGRVIVLMNNLGIDVPDIIGLDSKSRNLAKKSNFESLASYIERKLSPMLTDEVMEKCKEIESSNSVAFEFRADLDKFSKHLDDIKDENSDFKKIFELFSFEKGLAFYKNIIDIRKILGYNPTKDESIVNDLEKLVMKAQRRYALAFSYFRDCYSSYYHRDAVTKEIIDYVNLIDSAKA